MNEDISDIDLNAYIDGELDPRRRIEVEAYLETHPEAAARVMHDMRVRNEIRLFMTEPVMVEPAATAPSALPNSAVPEEAPEAPAPQPLPMDMPHPRRPMRSPSMKSLVGKSLIGRTGGRARAVVGRGRRTVAALCLLGLGWVAHGAVMAINVNPVSAAHAATHYLMVAAEAHQQAVRDDTSFRPFAAAGHSPLAPLMAQDPAASVSLPDLDRTASPYGLRTVAWDGGVAVQAAYRSGRADLITLFASEVERFAVTAPQTERIGGVSVAYWQVGTTVYALCGALPESEILAHARDARMGWF
ncbi:anti-sigma factor family protein [Azospirillum soli]|uniref:anti-sigma factor family protein n=1 Tax=Azospirillum soli TaxID=1304799 RepID=UPI001AE9364B|nr:hypothetical protein [Azospirillum soli]MBP2316289.1 anti-sigma factor RsiW [Azospirillum soli]